MGNLTEYEQAVFNDTKLQGGYCPKTDEQWAACLRLQELGKVKYDEEMGNFQAIQEEK